MPNSSKVERTARLRWVPINRMEVHPGAQRELVPSWVDHIAASFDPEMIGTPTVNDRDARFFILDGQHRVEALKMVGWGDQQVQCWTYTDLTDPEMAEKFLVLNDVKQVQALDKFRASVNADREIESDIDRVVRAQGLVVSRDKQPGAIGAVGTLRRVYTRGNAANLGRTLRIIRDAYGDAGMQANVIDGIGFLTQRYNGELNDAEAVAALGAARGGVGGLISSSEMIRARMGQPRGQCVAAAAVKILNTGKRKKLPDWWADN